MHGKQIWPCRKKVKCQYSIFILAILVNLWYPWGSVQREGPGLIWFWRRRFLNVFTIYGHGSHHGQWTTTILAFFHSPNLRRPHMQFEQHWPRGFRGEVVDLAVKSSKSIYNNYFSNFGRPPIPDDLCKGSAPRHPLFWRSILKGFYHIWAWQPSWSMDHNHFSNLSFPQPKEAPHDIWATLAQRLQRRSCLNFSTFFPYKCMVPIHMHREANLTSP